MTQLWVGRYREGYVTDTGESVLIGDERRPKHGWDSPDHAVQLWRQRGDFGSAGTFPFENGKIQFDDVRLRPEFAQLGISCIWRAITFLPHEHAHAPKPGGRTVQTSTESPSTSHVLYQAEQDGTQQTQLDTVPTVSKLPSRE